MTDRDWRYYETEIARLMALVEPLTAAWTGAHADSENNQLTIDYAEDGAAEKAFEAFSDFSVKRTEGKPDG